MKKPLTLIAGPCIVESYDMLAEIAQTIHPIAQSLNINFILKAISVA